MGDIDNDEIVQIKCRLYILYLKYIVDGAELQVNLGHEHKENLDILMSNLNDFVNTVNITKEDLFGIYHVVLNELTKLMSHSFYRFCNVDAE